MVACIGMISPKRQEILLYLAISILAVNSVNVIITEWRLYYTDLLSVLNKYSNHVLIESGKLIKNNSIIINGLHVLQICERFFLLIVFVYNTN